MTTPDPATPLETLREGSLEVRVWPGCTRREHYELLRGAPLEALARDTLWALGSARGTAALFVVDVEGRYQLTVAPALGRVVLVPRMSRTRAQQREDALSLARELDALR